MPRAQQALSEKTHFKAVSVPCITDAGCKCKVQLQLQVSGTVLRETVDITGSSRGPKGEAAGWSPSGKQRVVLTRPSKGPRGQRVQTPTERAIRTGAGRGHRWAGPRARTRWDGFVAGESDALWLSLFPMATGLRLRIARTLRSHGPDTEGSEPGSERQPPKQDAPPGPIPRAAGSSSSAVPQTYWG